MDAVHLFSPPPFQAGAFLSAGNDMFPAQMILPAPLPVPSRTAIAMEEFFARKREEQPPEGFMSDFLTEFHRRSPIALGLSPPPAGDVCDGKRRMHEIRTSGVAEGADITPEERAEVQALIDETWQESENEMSQRAVLLSGRWNKLPLTLPPERRRKLLRA